MGVSLFSLVDYLQNVIENSSCSAFPSFDNIFLRRVEWEGGFMNFLSVFHRYDNLKP